jgi:hypothetical protein
MESGLIDRLVFNANFSSISAISWREQILYIRHLQDPKK